MTTVQIVGIVVAAAIVLLLIIALLVTRRRGSASGEPPAVTSQASFLDDAPQDSLSALGKAEQPMEDVTLDPGVHRQGRPWRCTPGSRVTSSIGCSALPRAERLSCGASSRNEA